MANPINVNSKATILKKNKNKNDIQEFSFGTFNTTNEDNFKTPDYYLSNNSMESKEKEEPASFTSPTNIKPNNIENNEDLLDIKKQLKEIQTKLNTIESGPSKQELDNQIVEAMKALKGNSEFFEKASLSLESKVLNMATRIATKIIDVEIGEQSQNIAKQSINNILQKIEGATKININLNPKDFLMLKDTFSNSTHIKLKEDINVSPGGVVINSNLGNFDGTLESKLKSFLEAIEMVN